MLTHAHFIKNSHLKLVWIPKKIINNLKSKNKKAYLTINDLKLNNYLNQLTLL